MTGRIDTAAEREKLEGLEGFTPGPWRCRDSRNIVTGPHGIDLARSDNWNIPASENRHNARLIAAAPDLLATVHRLLDALDAERAENERLREAMIDATAHLAAATSAYKNFAARHPKWGKPDQDALFGTRFKDFDAATVRARDALKGTDQ